MPNWCANTLEVSNSKEKIDAFESFLNDIKGKNFFDFFVEPATPESDWYNYNLENYGCKWNCDANTWERISDTMMLVLFDSPWAPPIQLYENMLTGDYEVCAEYYEPGMGYVGKWDNGVDECYEYSDIDSLDNIPDDLIESWGIRESMSMEEE
jgi:hypothetical protein